MLRPKPILYVALCDRDQWAVEAEWPDGTLSASTLLTIIPRQLSGQLPNPMCGWRGGLHPSFYLIGWPFSSFAGDASPRWRKADSSDH